MFSLLNKIGFIVTFVFFVFVIQCSTSSPLENDKLAQLIERLNKIQTKVDSMQSREEVLEAENAQLTERLDRMQTKMDKMEDENAQLIERLNRMQTKMEAENDKWTRKFANMEAENEKLKSKTLQDLMWQISHPKSVRWDDGPSSIRSLLTSPPTSCQELQNQNGLPMDGIHLLKSNNKIQAAFCRFGADGSLVSQDLIGQLDVKTKTAHFYVQRNSSFGEVHGVIPFDVAGLNEGGAFNLTRGIFTVPVPGIYHFDVSALKSSSAYILLIDLQVNGKNVGIARTEQTATGSFDVASLSASFRLAAGDTVNLFKNTGIDHKTQFIGWLVEEDLM